MFLSYTSGVLKMYVSSEGKMIPEGTAVSIYRVQNGKDLYVLVSEHASAVVVRLPYDETSEHTLLGDEAIIYT